MFNKHDIDRDACQLFGAQASKGYEQDTMPKPEQQSPSSSSSSSATPPSAETSPSSAKSQGNRRSRPT